MFNIVFGAILVFVCGLLILHFVVEEAPRTFPRVVWGDFVILAFSVLGVVYGLHII